MRKGAVCSVSRWAPHHEDLNFFVYVKPYYEDLTIFFLQSQGPGNLHKIQLISICCFLRRGDAWYHGSIVKMRELSARVDSHLRHTPTPPRDATLPAEAWGDTTRVGRHHRPRLPAAMR